MRECMDAPNLHRRLNKILGQVKAIDKMVDEETIQPGDAGFQKEITVL